MKPSASTRTQWLPGIGLLLINAACLLARYGTLPMPPSIGDEIIINDASITLAETGVFRAASFANSSFGLDKLFAHFPPLYPLTAAIFFRLFGFSVYTLRLTTTVMGLLAAAVFLFTLRSLYRRGLLSGGAALAAGLVYCTCSPMIIMERIARMESMIAFFLACSFALLLRVLFDEAGNARFLIASGFMLGLCMAVHPEAITAALFLLPLMLAVRTSFRNKLLTAAVAVSTPILIWVATFRGRSWQAVMQFRSILHETPKEPGLSGFFAQILHGGFLTSARFPLLVLLTLLIALLPIGCLLRRRVSESEQARRFYLALAVAGLLELFVMQFVLRINVTRYEFLTGPLLISVALLWLGARTFRPLWWAVPALLCVGQVAVMARYLHPTGFAAERDNAHRFDQIVADLPASDSVAAVDDLWLAFRQAHRPFSLIYPPYDGRAAWAKGAGNPLDRFDAVIEQQRFEVDDPWIVAQIAAAHRPSRDYLIAGEIYTVYLRSPKTVTASPSSLTR